MIKKIMRNEDHKKKKENLEFLFKREMEFLFKRENLKRCSVCKKINLEK